MDDPSSDDCKISDSENEHSETEDYCAKYWKRTPDGLDARKLFNNDAFSDVTIKYAGKEISAHRVILSMGSKYFNKILKPNAQSKRDNGDVLQLGDESEEAVDDMLHWLYSYEYFASSNTEVIHYMREDEWERHLDAAIIAAKYGIPTMEKYAIEICGLFLDTFRKHIDMPKLAKRALQYTDKDRLLAENILSLSEGRFAELFKINDFRNWLARHPMIKKQLIDENFLELIETDEFRTYLVTDGGMALRQIDRLMASEEGSCDNKVEKKRKVDPKW